ncbi:MAG: hypothetical protein HC936_11925 [Leptolyngbyaceae cyanobacterium SU_3_3]|nr:hypothetical protein [Leptolyngbyaceae cyanobacterium SU_3_3]NJR52485.1 hypothetical protein [Leptolyngbyaceae cyanobacterium CSU_1_3]
MRSQEGVEWVIVRLERNAPYKMAIALQQTRFCGSSDRVHRFHRISDRTSQLHPHRSIVLLKSALLRRYRKGRTTHLSTFAPLTRSALLTIIERSGGALRCTNAPYKINDRAKSLMMR